jgi:Transposase DDE domain
MNKSRKKTPKALLEAAFNNYIGGKVPDCFSLLSEISESDLAGLDKSLFQKTLILLLVGEFFGCHTLNQILTVEMVPSGTWHSRLASLTYRQIELAVCSILKQTGLAALGDLAKKSDSSWSRAAVSLVIDDSIFKQWLTHGKIDPATAEYFDRYFSGQTKSVVYGFRITLCGLAIDDTFYPMYFTLTKKADNTRKIACDLLNQAHKDITLMCKKEKLTVPNLFLSVDSGFHGLELLNLCATFATSILPLTLVCVPKNNHIIEIQATKDTPEFRGKLPEFIDKHFKIAEAKFYEDPNNKDQHFTMRLKINYVSVDTELIILIFRFQKSQKVSVIYTTDLNIKAKTLRHRWFQRTHIEQFFRLLKDTLKIQLSKSTDKNGFVKKFCIKLFQALHVQLFRNYCRRKFRYFRKMAFPKIRLLMIANFDIQKILKKYFM